MHGQKTSELLISALNRLVTLPSWNITGRNTKFRNKEIVSLKSRENTLSKTLQRTRHTFKHQLNTKNTVLQYTNNTTHINTIKQTQLQQQTTQQQMQKKVLNPQIRAKGRLFQYFLLNNRRKEGWVGKAVAPSPKSVLGYPLQHTYATLITPHVF